MNVPLKRRNQIRKFHIRWNSHADLGVYYQVFIEKEYSLAVWIVNRIQEKTGDL